MSRYSRSMTSLIMFISIMMSAVSCNIEIDFGFKELCFYHPHTAPVNLNVDWSKFEHIEQPTGMTAYVWPHDESEEMQRFVTHNLNSITLDLEAGYFNAFVFNQSDSEYATIEFYNMDEYDKAEVRVRQMKSSWYSTKLPVTKIGSEPEWLAIDSVKDIEVTQEMVEIAEEEYLANLDINKQKSRTSSTKTQATVTTLEPKSIIKNVDLYVHIENLPYLRSVRAVLEDMAEGCYISTMQTTSSKVSHMVESWTVIHDKNENGVENLMKGVIKTTISTFGVPAGHTGADVDNNLSIKLLLVDNLTVLEMDFPVGDQLANINEYDGTRFDEDGNIIWPEIHVEWPEPLPHVDNVDGKGGAFDVGVGSWGDGDEVITELPLI